ncbi:hypothetical protein ACFQLX_03145 [Streptomyces polyrhachis]|uniref:Uncharacterized protein n=1 Tax=Streptomyces polyrhachis TaxID=1282885 RepID=A0ABW2GC92_9ACTN
MNGKRTALAALATAAVLGALLPAGPALAQSTAAESGYRIAPDAQPVKGAESSADGPELKAGTVYRDRIGPGGKLYYKIELDAKSNSFVQVVAAPGTTDQLAFNDGISISILSAGNTTCGKVDDSVGTDNRATALIDAAYRLIEPDGDCQEADVYNVLVERVSKATSTPDDWTLELRPKVEPPVTGKPGGTPQAWPEGTPPPRPGIEARPITGGRGLADAAGMYDGVWKDRIPPGQTRYYRVPLDWGQSLATHVEFGTVPVSDDSAWHSSGASVEYYDPAGWHVGSGEASYNGREQAKVVNWTPKIDYATRFSDDSSIVGFAYAGWYVVAVHVHQEVGKFVKGTVPVVLRTSVKGEPAAGPVYAGDAVEAGFGVGEDDREAAKEGLSAAQADTGGGLRPVLGYVGVGVGSLLILGLGGWWLLGRRTGAGPADAAGPANPYQQPPGGGYGYPPQ